MSFYTSLTGLNASQADLAAISNNIANVGTTGFKLSTAQFGDIFANSPLQNANAAVGSGTILKKVQQQFTQGNIESSQNSLDMAISGQGFFALKPSLTSTQTVYTRNGTFTVNNNNYIVDSQGEYLQGFPVNSDGSVIATDAASAINLQIPSTSGLPKATSNIQLGLNLPANATIIPSSSTYTSSNPYVFDHTNPATYNQSTSITIYDSLGNPTIATIYYVKTANATSTDPTNKWETHVFVGDKEVNPSLITAKSAQGQTVYINKFGQTTTNPTAVDSAFVPNQASPLYYQDQQNINTPSTAAQVKGAIQNTIGFDFGNTDSNTVQIITDPALYSTTREGGNTAANAPYWGTDMFTVSVDGSQPQSISINAGTYNGEQLAAEMTRAVNAKFSSAHYFRITDTYRNPGGSVVPGNDVFNVALSKTNSDGSTSTLTPPLEIDLFGTAGAAGTPASTDPITGQITSESLNYEDLTQKQLIDLAQSKINDALNARHDEFGKGENWVDASKPPIKVGFDVSTNSLTFTADPSQLGADATLPQNRYQTVQVYNPTSTTNDLGIPSVSSSPVATISASTSWAGTAVSPNGPPILDAANQRTGITVAYDKNSSQFVFSSGTTGEASSIQVGRATLAGQNDVLPQINSYDFTNLTLSSGQQLTLESDGKSFTYTVPEGITVGGTSDTSTNWSITTFMNHLQQAMPLTINPTMISQTGSATQKEIQTITPNGNILNGDKFTLTLQSDKDSTTAKPISLDIGPLKDLYSVDKTTGQSTPFDFGMRLNSIVDAINSAISKNTAMNNNPATSDSTIPSAYKNNTVYASISADGTGIDLQYLNTGSVTQVANLFQNVRGISDSDYENIVTNAVNSTTPAPSPLVTVNTLPDPSTISSNVQSSIDSSTAGMGLQFASQTIVASPSTELVAGNSKLAESQSITLQPSDITKNLSIKIGDAFDVTIPLSNGTTETHRVTITQAATSINGVPTTDTNIGDAASVTDLVAALNASMLKDNAVFSPGAHNNIVFTNKALGALTGSFNIQQVETPISDPALMNDSTMPLIGLSASHATPGVANATAEVQSIVLPATLAAGTYNIMVPYIDSNGKEQSVSVNAQLTYSTGATPAPDLAAFVTTINNAINTALGSPSPSPVKASVSGSTLSFTQANKGPVTNVASITNAISATIHANSIGPYSISTSGGRLIVTGNPDGSSFRLNVLKNGISVVAEAQGAIGSKTQAGREIGQSLATTANISSFFAGSNNLLGIGVQGQTSIAGTGLASSPAVATGTSAVTPMNQTFLLDASLGENVMTVTVDGITGTINLPISSYTGDTFAAAIQQRINQIQDPKTGQVVSGVTVKYDSTNNRLIFTSGTQGSTSQINVVGSANFGLSNATQTPGSVPSITVLQQATDANGNKLYVDAYGNITTQAPTTKLQDWSPLYLTPGELTFNTAGNLISPIEGVVYSPFDPGNGSNPLHLTINYGKLSTQHTQPFSVQSLTQDGYPSGSLNGLSIDASGTVTASYTNGQSTALGKVMIANFANQNGLKQVGNTNYVETAASGGATLGQAGSNGFGSIQAGALEQSNVDITQELVSLITAQRNFQANAKAIETDTTLTSTIVQIRA